MSKPQRTKRWPELLEGTICSKYPVCCFSLSVQVLVSYYTLSVKSVITVLVFLLDVDIPQPAAKNQQHDVYNCADVAVSTVSELFSNKFVKGCLSCPATFCCNVCLYSHAEYATTRVHHQQLKVCVCRCCKYYPGHSVTDATKVQ